MSLIRDWNGNEVEAAKSRGGVTALVACNSETGSVMPRT